MTCPAAPGAVSEGATRDEALRNIADALALWLEVAREEGRAPADETPQRIAEEVEFVLGWRAEEGWDLVVELAVVELPAAVAA